MSQVHSNASVQSLTEGLDFLSRSIDQKSASLKVLVESNFERFVRAKTTIDNVYAEMRNQGIDAEPEKPRTHARITSKGSSHFRNASGQGSAGLNKGTQENAPGGKKNALLKESEYGVSGIKSPLIDAAVKAKEIWGPALGGREKEENLKLVMGSLSKNEEIFKVGTALSTAMKHKDYDKLVEQYSKARRYAQDAREMAENASRTQLRLTELEVHQIVITARMWAEVEDSVNGFKRSTWRKLTNTQNLQLSPKNKDVREEYMALISILLELEVEDNPIWVWLLSRYDYLKNKIHATFERSRIEIEVLRRQLGIAEKPTPQIIALHLRYPSRSQSEGRVNELDIAPVIELWELTLSSLNNLLSVHDGILGEVIDFWDKAQKFTDGKIAKTLPVGIDGQSRAHHRLSADGTRQLQDGVVELVEIIRENLFSFFADPPIEDLSMLYSPVIPQTPKTPISPISASRSHFPRQENRFRFDAENPPPPSPKFGEAWEDFAFWPPFSNSLSGAHYLAKILSLLGTAAGEMLAISPVASETTFSERLRFLVAGARERSAKAVCAAWNRDAELCKVLEDWTCLAEKRDLTRMPSYFKAFEAAVLSGMQRILYIPDATSPRPGAPALISPPPAKLLQVVRNQFVTTLYRAFSGMVENAENPTNQNSAHRANNLIWTDEATADIAMQSLNSNNANTRSRVGHPFPFFLARLRASPDMLTS